MSSAFGSRAHTLSSRKHKSHRRRDLSRRQMFFESLEGRSLLAGADAFADAPLIPNVATFSDPTDTTGFTLEGTEVGSTLGTTGTTSAWWRVQTPTTGIVTIHTYETHYNNQCCGPDFLGFGDTTLEVFTGAAVDNLTLVTNNDDISLLPGGDAAYPYPASNPQGYVPNSRVSFTAAAGTTYYVRLNGFGGTDFGPTSFTYSFTTDLYVDDGFAGFVAGQVIADADQGTTGAQPATFGVNAFATINDALTASAANGTIIVNGGTYGEAISLASTRTLRIGGANAAQAVAINAISGVAGTTINLAGTSTLSVGDASSTTISSLINGSGNLTKTGSGTLTLDNSNTYGGATTISGGVLRTGGHQAYQITGNTNANQFYGGSLGYDFVVGAGRTITVTQLGFYDANPAGLTNAHNVYISTNGGTQLATAVVPAGTAAPLVGGYRFVNLATPLVLGAGTYRVWGDNYGVDGNYNSGGPPGAGPTDGGGSGELTFVNGSFFGGNNTFPTTPDGGPAYRYGAASFNFTTQVLPAGTAVNITSAGAALDLANSHQTIGSLTGVVNSAVTMGAGSLTVSGSASTTFGGSISGSGNLNKAGTGTLTLSGANTYTGSTNVLAGTLKAGAPITTNLLAFYDFNDSSNLGLDRSGNNNTGALTGGAAASSAGNIGGALSLPGNATLNLPNLAAMFGGQAATLSIWTKLNVGTPTNSTLTGFANFGSGSNNHYPWVDGFSYQNVFRNNSRVDGIGLDGSIDRTQWHLVTIVSDPTDAATGWRMYQNGTLIRSTSPVFGISGFQVGVQNGFFLNGAVDDVRLYNRALSTAEVQALFNSNVIPDTSPVIVSHGATFELGATETIGSLAGLGSVNLGSNTLYTGGNNSSTTYGGAISGTGGVTKLGSGTMTLSGVNTYSGQTNVNAGTLNLGGTGTLPAIAGLYEWFDAADASTMTQSGGTISQWRDKSGNNRHMNQGAAANQPSLVGNQVNGNSMVRFDGNDVISSPAAGNTPGTPYTVLSAARLDGSQNQRLITSNNNWLLGYWGGGMDQFYADGSVRLTGANPVPDSAVHFYGATGTGSLSTFFDGNRLIASNNGGLTSPNGISLGAWAGTLNEASKGDVAELLVYTGVLGPAQLAEVYAYLQTKWLAKGSVLSDASSVTVASGANLNVNVAETVGNFAGAGTTTLNRTLTVTESANTTYSGNVHGAGGLTKLGAGTLTLSGAASSYGGITTVNAGTVIATTSAALGTAAGGTTVHAGATLSLTGGITIGDSITASGAGVGGQGALRSLSGNNIVNGAINLLPDVAAVALDSTSAAASFSQSTFSPKQMIDGLTTVGAGGWANFNNPNGSTAVFETVANLNPGGANAELTFSILSGGYTQHSVGRFKLYVTTDNRANFADGLDNNGQIGTNWQELSIVSAVATGGATLTVMPDNSILASGANPDPVTYTIKGLTSLANITGVRIQTIEDASFVNSGPGRSGNGNYVLIEWGITSADGTTSNVTIGSDPASTLTINGVINNPTASGTVTFVGAGNVSLGAASGISGATNVVKNNYGTLTNAGANNNFAGTLAINNGRYIAAHGNAFGTTAGATSVGIDASVAFTGGINVGAETMNVTAVNGNAVDSIINLSGNNTFGGSINVVPFTHTVGTSTGVITGGDAGDGVDLIGSFRYAVNTGGTPSGPVQGVAFTSTEGAGTPGMAFSAPNVLPTYTAPNYGDSTNDNAFEAIMQSIRWNTGLVDFDFTGLVPGRVYKVQLLFSDAYNPANRRFNIVSEGVTLATNFTSGATTSNPIFTQILQAGDSVLDLTLVPGSFGDTNPIISAITIEDLGASLTTHDLNIRSDSGTLALHGGLGLNASVLTVKGAGNVSVGGSISQTGASSLVKTGSGTLTLSNANAYSGGTTISQGTVIVQNSAALDGGPVNINDANTGASNTALLITNPAATVVNIPNSITVNNQGSGTTTLGSTAFNIGSFASIFSGPIALNKATTLTGGNADRTTYSNTISGTVGALTVTGGSATEFSAGNTYAGNTVVTGAGTTLLANNGSGSATGNGTVNAQTGTTLGGTGSIAGATTVAGTLAAGDLNAIGTLTINNNLTLLAGATLHAQLNSPASYDQVIVTGDVNVSGALLSTTNPAAPVPGDTYRVIRNDGPNATIGQFAGLATDPKYPASTDQITTIGGLKYYVTYNDNAVVGGRFGTGNDVALIRNRTVTAVNDDLGSILRNTSISGNVYTNDIDLDRDGALSLTTNVAHGTLVFNAATGAFTYTPAIDYIGPDSFTYRLFDGEHESFGTVSVEVTPAVVQGGVLYIAGTVGNDRITIQPLSFGGNVAFRYNNVLFTPYTVPNKVVVFGLAGTDNITVTGNVNVPVAFYGGEGNDYLAGGNLNDVLDGGNGVDRLLGGVGDDTLYGGADNDTLSGGNNNDLLDGDSYTDIPTVITGGNLASLIGAILLPPINRQGKDTVNGDNGDDRLLGRGNDDTLNGGNNNDVIDGDVGNDKIDGGSGDDLLVGGAGGDQMYGRAGADVMVGGMDVDTIYGATGADLILGDNVSNPAALAGIALSWVGGDQAGASAALKAIVAADNAVDTLHGEADADWYLMFINDKLKLASEGKTPNVVIPLP